MATEGGLAFARLFAKRRDELDVSVLDIATRTGRPIEVVVGWEQGSAVPDDEELVDVSAALKLPLPLLEEALRRVHEHRMLAPPPEPDAGLDEDTLYDVEIVELKGEALADSPTQPGTVPPESSEWSSLKLISRARQSVGRRRAMARRRPTDCLALEISFNDDHSEDSGGTVPGCVGESASASPFSSTISTSYRVSSSSPASGSGGGASIRCSWTRRKASSSSGSGSFSAADTSTSSSSSGTAEPCSQPTTTSIGRPVRVAMSSTETSNSSRRFANRRANASPPSVAISGSRPRGGCRVRARRSPAAGRGP